MFPVCLFLMLFEPGERPLTLVRQIADSGQVLEIAIPAAERLQPPDRIAPGAPPLLRFRTFEGNERHRFANLDLVMDDAGH
jgi:hypothetical protein